MNNPAPFIDHTLLAPTATVARIQNLCEEAVEYGFAAVCVPPVFVPLAAELTYGSDVRVATVVGFPLGFSTLRTKLAEVHQAVATGAVELDIVIHLGAALEGRLDSVEREIHEIVRGAGRAAVKVILECCYLADRLKTDLTFRAAAAGAAFVKTSTGFGPHGAKVDDVRLLVDAADGRIGVKAAGGIRDWVTCRAMLAAGATRIGTSSGPAIVDQWRAEH